MDILSMLRTLGALGVVLGMLAGALWAVRRYDIKLPGRISGTGRKRVELVERLSLDAKRSVALIRRDGCEHLIVLGPDGTATIETGIVAPEPVAPPAAEVPAKPAASANFQADLAHFATSFGKLVDLSREKIAAVRGANDDTFEDEDGDEGDDEPTDPTPSFAPTAELPQAAPRKRTRRPRDTARWNRRAVREAINA
ncbi:FliO/MopB family protein [Sphingomonas sp. MMS12-HWE2-04]|uniref:FliO/MopB family protein n=1 Tax=Sphingomonas sp. MMS12-HWE2-04 TaxID=3234199 RepID=UPI00384BDEF5